MNDLHAKERRDLDPMINMTEGRYVGKLHNQTKEEIHIIDEDQIILSEKGAYNEKIFFTTQANHHEERPLRSMSQGQNMMNQPT